jgi:phosphatidylglycerophosphate synthase
MLVATVLLLLAAAYGALPTWGGLLLLLFLGSYLYAHYRASRTCGESDGDNVVVTPKKPAWLAAALLAAGLAMLFAGPNSRHQSWPHGAAGRAWPSATSWDRIFSTYWAYWA